MHTITGSIVVYNNNLELLLGSINSFIRSDFNVKLFIIDNSSTDILKNEIAKFKRVEYIFNNKNLGFGRAHNHIIRTVIGQSDYHLIFNPDIIFEPAILEKIVLFMEAHKDIGLVMPKIYNFDSSIQHVCKLLPTPFDLIIRRLNSDFLYTIFKSCLQRYELINSGYNTIIDVPHLSGSFMFIRNRVLKEVGGFDERFFMYLEDVDLSRRINKKYRNVYYPEVFAYHQHGKHSYSKLDALLHHIRSAVKYFNKWGWFFDNEREEINRITLQKINALGQR